MFFLVELLLWLGLPLVVGWAWGLPGQLQQAARGLRRAQNRQMSRLQFLTQLSLLGLPVMYFVAAILGAWFGERRWALLPLLAAGGLAAAAAWCGQRIEQITKQIQGHHHESIEAKRLG